MKNCFSSRRGNPLRFAARVAAFGIVSGLCLAPSLLAVSIVAPNGLGTADGNSNNVVPFSPGWFGDPSTNRYQQVYAANQFGGPGTSLDIGSIAFRLDAGDAPGPFTATFPSVQVDLSTISAGPDGLSATFANNVGANDTVVYNGSLTLTGQGGGNPNPFSLVINLQTPFLYNYSQGNLLLDIRMNAPSNSPIPALDAQFTSGDGVSRVWSSFTGSVNSTTGNVDTIGLVTEFNGTVATPEPAGLGLSMLGFGLVAVGGYRAKRRSKDLAAVRNLAVR